MIVDRVEIMPLAVQDIVSAAERRASRCAAVCWLDRG